MFYNIPFSYVGTAHQSPCQTYWRLLTPPPADARQSKWYILGNVPAQKPDSFEYRYSQPNKFVAPGVNASEWVESPTTSKFGEDYYTPYIIYLAVSLLAQTIWTNYFILYCIIRYIVDLKKQNHNMQYAQFIVHNELN